VYEAVATGCASSLMRATPGLSAAAGSVAAPATNAASTADAKAEGLRIRMMVILNRSPGGRVEPSFFVSE
jgi:hypothetical protein